MQDKSESKVSGVQQLIDLVKGIKNKLETKPNDIPEGLNPYHIAAITGNEGQMIQLMAQSNAAYYINELSKKPVFFTPLQLAVMMNSLGIVRLIKKYFPSALYKYFDKGSILHFSIVFGTFEITQEFLVKELINETNKRGQTPLVSAILKNKIETVKALLELGCPVDCRAIDNYDELAYAVMTGNLEIFKLITERPGLTIDYTKLYIRPDQNGLAYKDQNQNQFCFTLLGLAAAYNAVSMIEALLPHYSRAQVDAVVYSFATIYNIEDASTQDAIFLLLNKRAELKGELTKFSAYCTDVIKTQRWNQKTLQLIIEFGKEPPKKTEQKKRVKKEPVKKKVIQIPDSPPRQPETCSELVRESVAYTYTPIETPAPIVPNDPIIEEINRGNLGWVFEQLNISKFSFDNPYAEAMEQGFLLAVANNQKEIASIFLGQPGFNQNKVGHKDWRPIHVALSFKREEMAKYLLERGVDYSEEFLGRTILCGAAEKGFISVIEELLPKANEAKDAAIVSRKKQNIDFDVVGGRALIEALKNGHSDVALALIRAGATVNVKDRNNLTPLMYAARWGFAHVVDALMKQEADIESFDVEGCNALLHAIKTFAHYADELKKNESYLNEYGDESPNALLSATINRQLETIKVLFSYKPGLYEKNDKGEGIEQYIQQYRQLNELFASCFPRLRKIELKASKRPAEGGSDFFSDKRRDMGRGIGQTPPPSNPTSYNPSVLGFYMAPGMYKS